MKFLPKTSPRPQVRRSVDAKRRALRLENLENRKMFAGLAPVAVNDLFEVSALSAQEDIAGPVAEQTMNVLANDTDAEGDPLSASLFSGPTHGQLTFNEDGSFQYTPDEGFEGLDGFLYQSSDGTGFSSLAAVSLQVSELEMAPVSQNDLYNTDEDQTLQVASELGVLANDSDANGDPLTVELVTPPASGTLELAEDGSFSYTPDPDFYGTDSFSYQVSDGSLTSDVAVVQIEVAAVNDMPQVNNDLVTMDEDGQLEAGSVLENDVDVDSQELTPSLVSEPEHGSLTFRDDGSFSYTPDPDFYGTDSFSYQVSDGSLTSDVALVQIEVAAVNDSPHANNDLVTVEEDGQLEAGSVLENDVDVDSPVLTPSLVSEPEHGSLTFREDGSFSYTPDADFYGTDSFVYQVSDGELSSELAVVEIEIQAINDAPIAVDDAFQSSQNALLTITPSQLLQNDIDPEGDPLQIALQTPPEHGEIIVQADGSFLYSPQAGFAGEDQFTYQVTDGQASATATVRLSIAANSQGVQTVNDSYSVDMNSGLSVTADEGVLNNDNFQGQPAEVQLFRGPTHGQLQLNADGSFEYQPEEGYVGIDSFVYRASSGDQLAPLAVVTLHINAVENAASDPIAGQIAEGEPEATDEAEAVTDLVNDLDDDCPTTQLASLQSGPSHHAQRTDRFFALFGRIW